MEDDLVYSRKRLERCYDKTISRQTNADIQFSNIPEDILATIFSKLPLKDVVRTSALPRKLKHIWTVCPELRFDGATMCGDGTQHDTQKFIGNVNALLKHYRSNKVVEALEVKFEFNSTLAEHLDDWVKFALSARVNNLALDLLPAFAALRPDRYRFPFELFDAESVSCMQHLQLSFVSFESACRTTGFPNLKKLDLHVVDVDIKTLQDMLSNCFNLQWPSIVRCNLCGELKTFVYRGLWIPFHLGCALTRNDARLFIISKITLEFAIATLPTLFPSMQNLILHSGLALPPKVPCLLGNKFRFSQLKCVQLKFIMRNGDLSNLLSLASFLNAAPFIEKLEMHFGIYARPRCSEVIRRLPRSIHNHLRNLYITEFAGCTGQIEFLVHIVENSPKLEFLAIDRANYFSCEKEYEREARFKALEIVKRHLDGRVSQNTKVVYDV